MGSRIYLLSYCSYLGPGFSGVWVVICNARLVVVVGDVLFGLDWTGECMLDGYLLLLCI
jgi:hypothetical protein